MTCSICIRRCKLSTIQIAGAPFAPGAPEIFSPIQSHCAFFRLLSALRIRSPSRVEIRPILAIAGISVVEAVEKVKRDWGETYVEIERHVKSIEECGKGGRPADDINSLPRFNPFAQDGLSKLSSCIFQLDLLAPQLPSFNEVESAQLLLESWKDELHSLRGKWKRANLMAKESMRKAAQKERELLLGGGEESTIRRRNLQTKAGMTTAAESITDSLRRTRQLMVQEVERNANALTTVEESTTVLRKAESEYKGHRSLLMRTRNLLSTMQRQDVLDRVILIIGFLLFSCAVLYVVSKRMGLLKLQRTVTAAIKAGMAKKPEAMLHDIEAAINQGPVVHNGVGTSDAPPLGNLLHDEL